jgi:glycosyltransferase involved in cell wall biosynthesis
MKILLLLNDDIADQQRISKEIESLGEAGNLVILLQVPPQGNAGTNAAGAEKTISLSLVTRPLPKNLFFWALKWMEMVFQMWRIGMKVKPDVIHAVNLITLFPAYLIAITLHIPFIYDSQEIEAGIKSAANRPKYFWLTMEKRLSKKASIVFVTDKFRLEIMQRILKLDKSKMFVLMSLPRIRSLTTSSRNLRAECKAYDKKLAVYFGIGIPGRHLEDIIKAFSLLSNDFVFVFVGYIDTSYKILLMKIAEELEITQQIFFLPPVRWHELPSYISTADCSFVLYQKNSINNFYCSPSKLFDSIIAGLPVIGTDNPLIKQTLDHLNAGICIESLTPEALAASIKKIIETYTWEDRKRIARQGVANYTWESQENEFLSFYNQAIVNSCPKQYSNN